MRLKWFVIGVLVTLVALAAGAYLYLEKGFVDARADIGPSVLDSWLGAAMDASTGRHAPRITSPVPDTQENLLDAARTYASRCAGCHGRPDGQGSKIGEAFMPPAPQFFGDDPPDLRPNENFYIIKHGVRMTAMPAWEKLLGDDQIWQAVLLLKHINDKSVPPPIQQELSKPRP